jgi:hypothetical protein
MLTVADVFKSSPPPLYHYTGQGAFLEIVMHAKLWASKIQYLNDREEFALALRVATNVIDGRLRTEKDPDRRETLENMRTKLEEIANLNVCVCSLSAAPNQLSQWRAYGGGSGFCLGFNQRSLQELATQSGEFYLLQCVYKSAEHASLMTELVAAELGEVDPATVDWGPLHPGVGGFEANVSILASVIKHQAFEQEREWRLVSVPLPASQLLFRAGATTPIPYVEFSLSSGGPAPLRDVLIEVLVGPSPNQALGFAATQTLLLKHGVLSLIDVVASDIPFRSW